MSQTVDLGITNEELDRLYDSVEFKNLVRSIEESNARFSDLPRSQKFLAVALVLKGRVDAIPNLWRLVYKRQVPTIEEFLKPDYIGDVAESIYPQWKIDLLKLFDPNKAYYEWILTGAIGTGKSTAMNLAHSYNTFRINSLRNPQMVMGSMSLKPMNLQLMTVTKVKAGATLMTPFIELLGKCPYYEEVQTMKDFLDFKHPDYEHITPWCWDSGLGRLRFPNNVFVAEGSQDFHALGEDLFGGSFDEAEFRRSANPDAAFELYANILERVRSRFLGNRFILMTLGSSIQHETGIMATHIKTIPAHDKHSMVSQYSIWEVKFPDAIKTDGSFFVLRGNKSHPSKIISQDDEKLVRAEEYVVPKGCELIEVPNRYLKDFKTNVERALKNLAGKYTIRDEKPFDDASGVIDERLPPEVTIKAVLGSTQPLIRQLPNEMFQKTPEGLRLARYPNLPRYVHCDFADTGEAGITMVHKERSRNGQVLYVADFVLHIISPNRISYELVEEFALDWSRLLNIHIQTLTADQYQSVGFLQKMETEEVADVVKRLSVDRTLEPYHALENVISENAGRFGILPIGKNQLENIYYDKNKPYSRIRKDVADSICGAVYNAVINTKDVPINIYEDHPMTSDKKSEFVPSGFEVVE